MLKRITVILFLILFIASCSTENNPIAPVENQLTKEAVKLPPKNSKLSVETEFYESKIIDGNAGGSINFSFDYVASSGQTVQVYGNLTIPAGAFNTTENIELFIDNEIAAIDFFPSPLSFNTPLLLNLTFKGLVLQEGDDSVLDFYYTYDNQTQFELIAKNARIVNLSNGKLQVVQAQLPHFSRFGWFR
ncbi:MAG: hypothetical protein K8F36_03020 [Melioribacteraceae bacterium]|nr:hypothetical protein [Melioribacteraceae bacterium]